MSSQDMREASMGIPTLSVQIQWYIAPKAAVKQLQGNKYHITVIIRAQGEIFWNVSDKNCE